MLCDNIEKHIINESMVTNISGFYHYRIEDFIKVTGVHTNSHRKPGLNQIANIQR